MFKLNFNKPKNENIANNEYRVKNFIPYSMHWNENTILTFDNELIQVIRIGGFSFETADDIELDARKAIRNTLFKGMGSENLGLYFHIIRRKQQTYSSKMSMNMPEGFALYLDQKWTARHKNKNAFVNELYISIVRKGQKGLGIIQQLTQLILGGVKKEFQNLKDAFEELEEASGRIMNTLNNYNPRILGLYKEEHSCFSEIAEFFSKILTGGDDTKILHVPDNINKFILNNRLYFKRKNIEYKPLAGNSKFAGMVSLKEYGPKTWAGILDSFLQMPCEFVISQSFQFANRQAAIHKMELQQNRMIQAEDKAVSQIVEISNALDSAMSGDINFGLHHLTVMCMADTIKELDTYLSMAAVQLTNTGGIGIREHINMEPAFWAQLPGNFDFIVRSATINTMNLASFNSMHNYPLGKQKGNYWGEAVSILDTTSGTPYYFNFHLRDVGHTTIIGPTGSGKTVMMNFLCAQAQKFQCRLFFFDKDRGAEIFLRAINGVYTVIDPGQNCGFNPLQLPNTSSNKVFLLDWLKQLVSSNGELITASDIETINNAITGNYKLEQKDRRLSNIIPFLGIQGPGSLAGRIAVWHSDGALCKVFDNEKDDMSFDKANVFGFEMGEVLKNKVTIGPVLSYIFQKINMSLDGSPNMIVLDEAWALIDNPVFAPRIKDWLKVLRKLNTFVVFATQSVEDASKSAISDTLIQQTATQIFLPNLRATDIYKTAFMLSEREFQLIKSINPGSHYFLVKQGSDAVIAKIDLSDMDDVVNILAGRAETVAILDQIRQEYGNNPEIWLPKFIQRITEIKE